MDIFSDLSFLHQKCLAIAFAFLLINLNNVCSGEDIKFFDENGSEFDLTVTGGCYNFKPKWDNRATAIEVVEGCFNIFESFECTGENKLVGKGSHDLTVLGLSKAVSSVKLCSPLQAEEQAGDMRAPNYSLQEIWDAAVQEHNKYRRIHGVPDVKGNPEMHMDAQKWADQLARNNEFRSTTMGKYGANLASSFRRSKVDAVRDAIKRWYDKGKYYDYDTPGYNVGGKSTGAFSAIVWRATTDIGVGVAWDEQEEQWIINVFYSPPAMRTQFRENVPPPRQMGSVF